MSRFIFSLVFLIGVTGMTVGQNLEDKTIMTVNNTPVKAGEFLRVYKKNLDLVEDQKQKELDNYLNLYVDYKLKVAQAYDIGLDTVQAHKDEYRKYKHKLATSYMEVREVTDTLMREAFARQKEQLKARHILINAGPEASPQDTLAAYNELVQIRKDILSGTIDFELAARQFSDDPSAPDTGGDLGWFSVFRMLYQFENVAYNTPVGETSKIFRTQFGYHIVEVLDRRVVAKEVTAAHIMIALNNDDPNFNPEQRINELYSNLQQGASFSELAKQFSDDKNTAVNGGQLKRFGPGQLNAEDFEEQAFALANPGDYSKPFKTAYGWHIVKLLERHDYPSFQDVQVQLRRKVEQAQRLDYIKSVTREFLKERYNVAAPKELIPFFTEFLTDSITTKSWEYTDKSNPAMKRVIYDLPEAQITYHDFATYINDNQRRNRRYSSRYFAAQGLYQEFELFTLREYFKDHLDLEDEGFATIVKEYKEGLLIFDLMDQTIWSVVKEDSLGLETFYNANKSKYMFKERVTGLVAVSPDKAVAKAIRKDLKKGKTLAELKAIYATPGKVQAIFTEGTFQLGARELPADFKTKNGVSKLYNTEEQFTVIQVNNILPAAVMPLEKIRGRVMGDYQTELETRLMAELKAKFPVSVKAEVLEEIKNQL